jgi:hypothetical protein
MVYNIIIDFLDIILCPIFDLKQYFGYQTLPLSSGKKSILLCPTERQSLSPEIDRTDAQYSPQIVVLN